MVLSARTILAYLKLAPWNHKRYSIGQAPKSAAYAAALMRVHWLARSRMEDLGRCKIICDKKKRVIQTHSQLW